LEYVHNEGLARL